MKRDKTDAIFSDLIRARAGWACERCGKEYGGRSMGLHCSHLVGRAHRLLRWHPLNAVAHCFGCHKQLGGDPIAFTDWICKHLGEERVDFLRERKQLKAKITKADKEAIHKRLLAVALGDDFESPYEV